MFVYSREAAALDDNNEVEFFEAAFTETVNAVIYYSY